MARALPLDEDRATERRAIDFSNQAAVTCGLRDIVGLYNATSRGPRGGEVDTIFGFEKEDDALQWIKEKSQVWLLSQRKDS